MKKLLLSLSTLFLFTSIALAQDSPEKSLAKAGRALGSYNLDPINNTDKLKEAVDLIEVAANSDATNGNFKTWNTRGEIYAALADKDLGILSLGQETDYVPEHPEAPVNAAESFAKALELAVKKFETKDALKGLKESAGKLNILGNNQIQRTDYASAYTSLSAVSMVNEIVTAAGEEPVIPVAEQSNHDFVLAFCAQAAGEKEIAKGLFKKLYEAGDAQENVYASYAAMLDEDGKTDEAWAVLVEGGEKYPASSDIMFNKINILIKQGKNSELKDMLVKAVEAEPNNPSVHSALGNVFMQLFTEEYATDRASTTAAEYFEESKKYFTNAAELDPEAFDAIYSVGSLNFNRAVEDLKYASGLTIAQQEEYEAANASATALMEEALPFFQKAESLNANDINTLIALSEIFARMSDFEKSKEFKARLQTVRDGGENEGSYFDK